MLKSLTSVVAKKKIFFATSNTRNKDINEWIDEFLKKEFDISMNDIEVKVLYHTADNRLVIKTPTKAVANELSLYAHPLAVFLKEKGFKLNKITIQ